MAKFPGLSRRRNLIATLTAFLGMRSLGSAARTILGGKPWEPEAAAPPRQVNPGPWVFFTPEEGALVELLADRLIPPDSRTPGGKDAGCAVFIDHQLAGPYGRSDALYMRGPFVDGTTEQGPQSPLTPAARYRAGIAALMTYVNREFGGRAVTALPGAQIDDLLKGLESGDLHLPDVDGKAFFTLLLTDVKAGFFSDPVYGGNRGMAAWKMIGFPGARYDYSDWVENHNQHYPLPPVGISEI